MGVRACVRACVRTWSRLEFAEKEAFSGNTNPGRKLELVNKISITTRRTRPPRKAKVTHTSPKTCARDLVLSYASIAPFLTSDHTLLARQRRVGRSRKTTCNALAYVTRTNLPSLNPQSHSRTLRDPSLHVRKSPPVKAWQGADPGAFHLPTQPDQRS